MPTKRKPPIRRSRSSSPRSQARYEPKGWQKALSRDRIASFLAIFFTFAAIAVGGYFAYQAFAPQLREQAARTLKSYREPFRPNGASYQVTAHDDLEDFTMSLLNRQPTTLYVADRKSFSYGVGHLPIKPNNKSEGEIKAEMRLIGEAFAAEYAGLVTSMNPLPYQSFSGEEYEIEGEENIKKVKLTARVIPANDQYIIQFVKYLQRYEPPEEFMAEFFRSLEIDSPSDENDEPLN